MLWVFPPHGGKFLYFVLRLPKAFGWNIFKNTRLKNTTPFFAHGNRYKIFNIQTTSKTLTPIKAMKYELMTFQEHPVCKKNILPVTNSLCINYKRLLKHLWKFSTDELTASISRTQQQMKYLNLVIRWGSVLNNFVIILLSTIKQITEYPRMEMHRSENYIKAKCTLLYYEMVSSWADEGLYSSFDPTNPKSCKTHSPLHPSF